MTKQMGFIKNKENTNIVSNFDVDNIKAHRLIIGGTGSGKTTSYINNVLHNLITNIDAPSIIAYDEKSTISMTVKHMMKQDLEAIYEFSTMKVHDNSISINLLSYFDNDKDLRILFDTICKVEEALGDHKYWAKSAAALLFDTTKMLKSFQKICQYSSEITNQNVEFDDFVNISGRKKGEIEKVKIQISKEPITLSILSKYTIENRLYFKGIAENSIWILNKLKKQIVSYICESLIEKDALELDKLFDEAHKNAKKMSNHNIDYDGSSGTGPNGIFMTATSSINATGLCEIETLNDVTNTRDVIKLLEEKRRVLIIDSDALAYAATVSITKILFDRLSMRTRQQTRRPVHVLIDEASRIVLSREIELAKTMAIARESQLYLHLCFQSASQLQQLSEAEYNTIMENAPDIYTFSTADEPKDSHYYRHNAHPDKVLYANPIYITRKEMLAVESKYQKLMNAYNKIDYADDEVILFDPRLYEKKKFVYAIQYNSGLERLVYFENKSNIEFNSFRKMLQQQKEKEMQIIEKLECKDSHIEIGLDAYEFKKNIDWMNECEEIAKSDEDSMLYYLFGNVNSFEQEDEKEVKND